MSLDTHISIIKELDDDACSKLINLPIEARSGLLEIDLVWFNRFYTLHNIVKEKDYYDYRTQESFMTVEDLLELAEEIKDDSDIDNVNKFLAFIKDIKDNIEYFSNYNFNYYLG